MRKILLIIAFLSLTSSLAYATEEAKIGVTEVTPKNFSYLYNSIDGLSEKQLSQHNTLYLRYVNKFNEINSKLKTVDIQKANAAHSDYRSLKIDRSFANNGIILHELYFENLSSQPTKPSKCLEGLIISNFGSHDNYIADLKASMRATRNGWVISGYNPLNKKIENYIIESHDLYLPINIKPILVIDVWEHAYMSDYGIDKESYIKVFTNNINWNVVSSRLNESIKIK